MYFIRDNNTFWLHIAFTYLLALATYSESILYLVLTHVIANLIHIHDNSNTNTHWISILIHRNVKHKRLLGFCVRLNTIILSVIVSHRAGPFAWYNFGKSHICVLEWSTSQLLCKMFCNFMSIVSGRVSYVLLLELGERWLRVWCLWKTEFQPRLSSKLSSLVVVPSPNFCLLTLLLKSILFF